MKKAAILAGLTLSICLFPLNSLPAKAGSINGPESRVISAASGVFTYNGVNYVAASWCIGALQSKFSEDGVNLTDTQASSLISMGYSNVARGVAEGYLIPIDGGSEDTQKTETEQESELTQETGTGQESETTQETEAGKESELTQEIETEQIIEIQVSAGTILRGVLQRLGSAAERLTYQETCAQAFCSWFMDTKDIFLEWGKAAGYLASAILL